MEREVIFLFGSFILILTMTGGMLMFLESKALNLKRTLQKIPAKRFERNIR